MQYPTVAALGEMIRHPSIAAPFPDDNPCDAPWSLPEVLRVDAELLLWRGEPGAVSAAETKLQRSLELARQQAALSWELRTALSFARLRIGQDRLGDARELLAPVYGKFTEGFATSDLRSARAILESPRVGATSGLCAVQEQGWGSHNPHEPHSLAGASSTAWMQPIIALLVVS